MMIRIPVQLSLRSLVLLPLLFSIFTLPALAQGGSFTFGTPLRNKILFAYKYTERVQLIHTVDGGEADSSERLLTYFFTQHQEPAHDGNGNIRVQVNIDSMRLEYKGLGEVINFDTQKYAEQQTDISHREILTPSALVNRFMTFTITPYGQVVGVESTDLADVRDQVNDPAVDAITRERFNAIASDEYLTAVVLPWREVLPLGQKVRVGDTITAKHGTALDRLPIRGTVRGVLGREDDKFVYTFSSTPAYTRQPKGAEMKTTYTEINDPVNVQKAAGTTTGMLKLDEDGVVLGGWTSTIGEIEGSAGTSRVTTQIVHETYTEMINMTPYIAQAP